MFNQFSIQILERLHGKRLPVLLQEETGVSERTWRNRIRNGWNPGVEEIEELAAHMAVRSIEMMKDKWGWADSEAQDFFLDVPLAWRGSPFLPPIYYSFLVQGLGRTT